MHVAIANVMTVMSNAVSLHVSSVVAPTFSSIFQGKFGENFGPKD